MEWVSYLIYPVIVGGCDLWVIGSGIFQGDDDDGKYKERQVQERESGNGIPD